MSKHVAETASESSYFCCDPHKSSSCVLVSALLWPRGVKSPHIVYILRSESQPHRYYTGLTSDLRARLAAHNAGLNTSTASGLPWRVVTYVTFTEPDRATWFERYLKTGSGWAFAKRHLR